MIRIKQLTPTVPSLNELCFLNHPHINDKMYFLANCLHVSLIHFDLCEASTIQIPGNELLFLNRRKLNRRFVLEKCQSFLLLTINIHLLTHQIREFNSAVVNRVFTKHSKLWFVVRSCSLGNTQSQSRNAP